MTATAATLPSTNRNVLFPIVLAGLIAGTLDLAQAMIFFGANIPLSIAAGLLGRQAFHGGPSMFVLGVFLHFFIATTWSAVFYVASRKLTFVLERPILCGVLFGMIVELTMNLIVLPLSALHARGPYQLRDLLLGLTVHMVTVGLPISFTIRRFEK